MQDLKISIIQSELHWQNTQANLAMFEEKIWQIEGPTDLIILPEMFTTGFSMEASSLAEPMNFTTFRWMRQMAQQTKACVCGSFIAKDGENFFNRLLWMKPSGEFHTYDKRHLFRMANEHEHYSAGKHRLVVDLNGWKICPFICYDLRFPVFSRNLNNKGELAYDLAIYVANWPQARVQAWDILLKARAIENLCYVVGVNRVGKDGKEIPYNGHSAVISPRGEEIYSKADTEDIATLSLSYDELAEFRVKFPTQLDADQFTLN